MRTHALALVASVATLAAGTPATTQAAGLDQIFSCGGSKGTTGAVVGGLAGALAGRAVAKDNTLGTVVGAGLGAFAGNQVACRMSSGGRQKAEHAFQRALDTGEDQTWRDSRTGASGRIEVVDNGRSRGYGAPYAGDYARPVSTNNRDFARGVERVYRLSSASPAYRVDSRINLRAAPSTTAPIVDRLSPGERIEVVGATDNGWLAVEEAGLIRGYVSASVVRPVASQAYATTYGGGDCRIVEQTVNVPGHRATSERFRACRDRAGQWQVERA